MTRVSITRVVPAGGTLVLDLIDQAELKGGVGGWEEISRPRRSAAVEWTGTPTRTQVLPLLLNGMETQPGVDVSVEPQIAQLIAWGQANTRTEEPPVLALAGPLPAVDGRWVIQDLAWGPPVRDGAGSRIQQAVTVTLLEYQAPVIVSSPAKKAKAKKKDRDKNDRKNDDKKDKKK